jgi:CubicO group peptidase (beta-lactamase class C family)
MIKTLTFLFILAIWEPLFSQTTNTKTTQKWTSSDGYTIEAKFVRIDADALVIEKEGRPYTIPFSKLAPVSVDQAKRLSKTITRERTTTTQFTQDSGDLERTRPFAQGVDEQKLWELARYIAENKNTPIFSLLISRQGKLIFELYTGGIDGDASHYLMSVTKSMLSTLVGIAIDRGEISDEIKPLSEILPSSIFKNKNHAEKFSVVNLKSVMGMSALDAPVPPFDNSSRANRRDLDFSSSKNRLEFALLEDLLKPIGSAHQYNDVTPALASGALSYCTGKSAFDFAEENLFRPMGFKNAEWMHQDQTGIDMGGYGLRLRPMDMQKWGFLFLNKGRLGGGQIISEKWVAKSREPYIATFSQSLDYGWFWWRRNYETPLVFQVANGWKGQRLAINYEKQIVISMTACIEGNEEHEFFAKIMKDYIVPSIDPPLGARRNEALENELVDIRKSRPRYSSSMEPRMIPSIAPKEKRILFAP